MNICKYRATFRNRSRRKIQFLIQQNDIAGKTVYFRDFWNGLMYRLTQSGRQERTTLVIVYWIKS